MFDKIKINTKSVCCLGDLHGNFKDILYFIKTYDIKETTLIFCGDVGMGFYKPDYYNQIFSKIKRELSKRNIYCLFIRGNHDDPDDFNGNSYKDKRIRTLRDYSIVQIYSLSDTNKEGIPFNILAIGGATSIDRMDRLARTESRAWEYIHHHYDCSYEEAVRKCPQEYWIGEQPFYDEEKLNEIKNDDIKINAVCSHTCPDFCTPLKKDGIRGWLMVDNKLEEDINKERQTLTDVYNTLTADEHPISKWCYGHYHFHNFEIIDDIKFYLLDMDRNGRMDFVEIYNNESNIE